LTVTSSIIDSYGLSLADKLTASKFLLFMENLTEVVLQDAAVIFIQHPNRLYHPLFGLDLFQSKEFQSFVVVMRSSLGSSTSPLDASLERVLPGMNARFNTLASSQEQLFQNQQLTLKNLHYTSDRLDDFRELYISGHHLQQNLFVGTLNAAAGYANGSLLQELPVGAGINNRSFFGPRSPTSVIFPPGERTPGNLGDDTSNTTSPTMLPYPGYNYALRGRYISVMEMFDEWNGTGSYHNRPIVGGIAELNRLYKSQWRKDYNGAQKMLFSRVQRVCLSIEEAISNGGNKDTILRQYNDVFINDAKAGISHLVAALQSKGILPKQQRRQTSRGVQSIPVDENAIP
jgi:hypothetical protein